MSAVLIRSLNWRRKLDKLYQLWEYDAWPRDWPLKQFYKIYSIRSKLGDRESQLNKTQRILKSEPVWNEEILGKYKVQLLDKISLNRAVR